MKGHAQDAMSGHHGQAIIYLHLMLKTKKYRPKLKVGDQSTRIFTKTSLMDKSQNIRKVTQFFQFSLQTRIWEVSLRYIKNQRLHEHQKLHIKCKF